MNRNQTFHETLVPLLVEGIGAQSYLELGTHLNETIGKVRCPNRYGVDTRISPDPGIMQFQMTTDDFLKSHAARYAPFDFVFIDADHSAEAVRRDLDGIWPFVSPEGIICLHDTNPETDVDATPGLCGDAWRVPFGWSDSGIHEAVTLPYHPGLTIIRKRIWWGPR